VASPRKAGKSSPPPDSTIESGEEAVRKTDPSMDLNCPIDIEWSDVLHTMLKALPTSLGEAKRDEAAKSGDPLPFSVTWTGDKYTLFIPYQVTADVLVHKAAAYYFKLGDMAGFEMKVTRREVDNAFWNSVKALLPALEGAYLCLNRKEITPMANIPKEYKLGWDFALWYSYAAMTGDENGGAYLQMPRVTSLKGSSATAWVTKERLADLVRLTSTIRLVSLQIGKSKDGIIRKFLKGKGYFLQQCVGKQPGAGLYHAEELPIVQENWRSRRERISVIYDKIPEKFSNIGPKNNVASIIALFNIENTSEVKKIEEYRATRIPELLIDGPKPKKGEPPTKLIAKGSGLPEKMINISGGNTVRSIGKVMYSPLIKGYTRNEFIDFSIKETNSLRHKKGQSLMMRMRTAAHEHEDYDTEMLLEGLSPYVTAAAQTYLEIIPDRSGNPAWDAVFPPT